MVHPKTLYADKIHWITFNQTIRKTKEFDSQNKGNLLFRTTIDAGTGKRLSEGPPIVHKITSDENREKGSEKKIAVFGYNVNERNICLHNSYAYQDTRHIIIIYLQCTFHRQPWTNIFEIILKYHCFTRYYSKQDIWKKNSV